MIEGAVSAEFCTAGYAVVADVLNLDELNSIAGNLKGPAMEALSSRKLLDGQLAECYCWRTRYDHR